MPIMPTNFAKLLAWKREYDVKLWRHKKRIPNANDHHMPLNEPPYESFLHTPLTIRDVQWSPMQLRYFNEAFQHFSVYLL